MIVKRAHKISVKILTTFRSFEIRKWNFFGIEALLSLFQERIYFAILSIGIFKARSATFFIMDNKSDNVSTMMSKTLNT